MTCLLIILGIITMGYLVSIFGQLVADKLQRKDIKRSKRIVQFIAGIGRARNLAIEKARMNTSIFRILIKRYASETVSDGRHSRPNMALKHDMSIFLE